MIDKKKIKETADKYAQNECGYSYDVNKSVAFEDGANWAIDEFLKGLWHDASEEPKENEKLLVERVFNGEKVYFFAYSKDGYYFSVNNAGYEDEAIERDDESRWLYIEDLMKGGEQ